MSQAIFDITSERQRQQSVECRTAENDDQHKWGELPRAAIAYIFAVVNPNAAKHWWAWDESFFKPKSPRKDLVRAAALLVAEIERLDRASEVSNG